MITQEPVALDDVRELLPDWRRSLRAANRSGATIDSYMRVANELAAFLVAKRLPTTVTEITHKHLELHIVHLQERPNKRTGRPLSTAEIAKHYRSLQQFFRWLEKEQEIETNPFHKMVPPSVVEKEVPVLREPQLQALLDTTKGQRTFNNLRDRSLMLLFIESGPRCGEVAPVRIADFDFDEQVVHVMGKGRAERSVPFGATTGEALRRYMRARAKHRHANRTDAFWLGRSGALTEWGIRHLLNRRADSAGVPRVHPHQFRHTFAHRWMLQGGQEQDLMRLAGWKSREMLVRYGKSSGAERARDAHRLMNPLGDLRNGCARLGDRLLHLAQQTQDLAVVAAEELLNGTAEVVHLGGELL